MEVRASNPAVVVCSSTSGSWEVDQGDQKVKVILGYIQKVSGHLRLRENPFQKTRQIIS